MHKTSTQRTTKQTNLLPAIQVGLKQRGELHRQPLFAALLQQSHLVSLELRPRPASRNGQWPTPDHAHNARTGVRSLEVSTRDTESV